MKPSERIQQIQTESNLTQSEATVVYLDEVAASLAEAAQPLSPARAAALAEDRRRMFRDD